MSFFILFIFTRYRFFLRPSNGVWNCASGAHFPTPFNHQGAISRSIFLGCKIAAPKFWRNFPKFGGRNFAPQENGTRNCALVIQWGGKMGAEGAVPFAIWWAQEKAVASEKKTSSFSLFNFIHISCYCVTFPLSDEYVTDWKNGKMGNTFNIRP